MKTLEHIVTEQNITPDVQRIILALASASKYINAAIRMKDAEKNKAENASGDTQSKLDIIADTIVQEALTTTQLVRTIASEEQENVVINNTATTDYCVAYDPYDGGSVGDVNMTFGSIYGIWERDPMNSTTGTGLVAACYALYGPRVTFVVGTKDGGVFLCELNEVGDFFVVREGITVTPQAQHFAPGNLKACMDDPRYKAVVDRWMTEGYKLRYSGALVTDVNHILLKGNGIFTYPADTEHPTGRLRLLYEGAPLTFLLECAGGVGSNQQGQNLLDEVVTDYHQRTSFFLGSREEVDRVIKKFTE